jgi:DNA uptake protein ComE-like DNA-binding protein
VDRPRPNGTPRFQRRGLLDAATVENMRTWQGSGGFSLDAPTTMDDGMIDPETATREQLVALPRMAETFADLIIAARPIDNMLEVDRILAGSLSEGQRDAIYARLWKPLDLNTATGEEILLVPGVGPRLQHEFEEYRPYVDIAQFRREMGKYVDNAEVDRLAKYVTIR